MPKPTRKSLIQSVERALNILEVVRDSTKSVRAIDIARAVGLSPAAANNIVRTLFIRGYLTQDDHGHYLLGGKSYLLGGAADSWGELRSVAREPMLGVSKKSKSLCFLGVECQSQMIAISIAEGNGPLIVPRNQDWLEQLHCTAAGKILLAAMPPDRYDDFKQCVPLQRFTNKTITDWQELDNEINAVRDKGFALCRDESVFGLCSIGVPVMDSARQHVVAALAVVFSSYYLNDDYQDQMVRLLLDAAATICTNLK